MEGGTETSNNTQAIFSDITIYLIFARILRKVEIFSRGLFFSGKEMHTIRFNLVGFALL